MKLSKSGMVTGLILLLLIIDQVVKYLVKTNMTIGESFNVFGDWFRICFVENKGMAFGMQFGGDIGKFLLTSFRIVFSGFVIAFLRKLIVSKANTGLLVGVSLILAGALGNLIDSLFYGVIYSASTPAVVAELFPDGGGYAPFFFGKVVDMLYFPMINATWPEWMPFVGGEDFTFFSPIFNIADSCVTVGVLYLLIFQYRSIAKYWN